MGAIQIKRVSFTHEALILWMLDNPSRQLRDAAEYFGYSQTWLSQIIHSDAFQQQLRKRQDQVAAAVASDIPLKLRGAAGLAIDKLSRHIEESEDKEFILDASDKLLKHMGFGAASSRNPGGAAVINNTINQQFNVSSNDLAEARKLMAPAPSQDLIPLTIEAEAE